MFLLITILLVITLTINARYDITYFGAISTSEEPDFIVATANTLAIQMAFEAASINTTDRVVYVPSKQFYFGPLKQTNIHNITFVIDGILTAHSSISLWPIDDDGYALNQIDMTNASNITIKGSGTIDGQGYNWWWWAISCAFPTCHHKDTRGSMIYWTTSENILIDGLTFVNSPRFHLFFQDCRNIVVRNFVIHVDIQKQDDIMKQLTGGTLTGSGIPTFPLNTDGIDARASNVHIYNGFITNFDDVVAFKPCKENFLYCTCASGFVENLTVTYGVGLTVGSVPPSKYNHCVRDVVFRNITMHRPLKGIHIKSNPGNEGRGMVANISYENIKMYDAMWWPIWIGPQQMSEPNGYYAGCSMKYPLDKTCPTNPLVTITDISLQNVISVGGLNPYPGVILCNASNPGKNFFFRRVKMTRGEHSAYSEQYIVKHVHGVDISSEPDVSFM